MLKIAIPNKGSLAEGAMKIIKEAGYKCRRSAKELLCTDPDNQVEFVFLRPKDIATYVNSGTFTFGITGRDIVADTQLPLNETLQLGFGKASMRYIIRGEQEFSSVQDFQGKKIACSYPGLLKTHLDANKVEAEVIKLDGAVEISIHLGIADLVADVVETGTTIRLAGLKPVGEPILKSEAVLISKLGFEELPASAQTFVKRLKGIIHARQHAMIEYDIPVEKLEEACALCPGMESPTVAPLQDVNWRSVKAMAKAKEVNGIMDDLAALGARAIILTEIRNCRI